MKMLYPLAKRFIAGHNFESAKGPIQKLLGEGYEVSIDYIGENSKTMDDCNEAVDQYFEIINFYKDKKIDISIKPSQLGLLISPVISYENLNKIAEKAKRHGHTIRLDMEDVDVTSLTISHAISLNKKFGNVGVAIQANLQRSGEDICALIDHDVSIRLVKGAYKGDLPYDTTSAQFFALARQLRLKKANTPAIATHDEKMLQKIDNKYYDYEFLYGIRRDLQKRLKNNQHRVRIYIPFGSNWLPYTLRRLKEWKNLKFIVKNVIKELIK